MSVKYEELHSLYAAIPMIKRLFGLVADPFDLIEIAGLALPKMGGLRSAKYAQYDRPDEEGLVRIPKAFSVEKVVAGIPEAALLGKSVLIQDENFSLGEQEGGVGIRLYPQQGLVVDQVADPVFLGEDMPSGTPVKGPYLPFTVESDHDLTVINLGAWRGPATIVFKTLHKDENGYPMVTKKALEAVAYYYNWVETFKRHAQQLATGEALAMAEKYKNQRVNQAKVGKGPSDATMSQVLDVLHSFHRHKYGDSFHPQR